jgi:hypothetical protein
MTGSPVAGPRGGGARRCAGGGSAGMTVGDADVAYEPHDDESLLERSRAFFARHGVRVAMRESVVEL